MYYAHRLLRSLSSPASFRTIFLILGCCTFLFAKGQFVPRSFDMLLAQAVEARSHARSEQALELIDSAKVMATANGNMGEVSRVMIEEANICIMHGQYNAALSTLYEAEKIRNELSDEEGLAEVYNSIGAVYQYQKNYIPAEEQYTRSLRLYEKLNDRTKIARSYNNFGSLYSDMDEPEKALAQHRRSLEIWSELKSEGWMAVSYSHMGNCMEQMGKLDSARFYYQKSLKVLKGGSNSYMESVVSIDLGNNYRRTRQPGEAIQLCKRALDIAERMDAVPMQQRACECLYQAYEKLGNGSKALEHYKRYILLRDSVYGQENVKEMTRIELTHNFAQEQLADSLAQAQRLIELELRRQEEVSNEREHRNIAFFVGISVFALAMALWSRLRYMNRASRVIQTERDRSDRLLLNILPEAVAQELKDKGVADAKLIEQVSVIFTDFVEFTQFAESLSPKEMVQDIHECFSAFDHIMKKHGVEKIKTIGDAYMAAGGLPTSNSTHAQDVVKAAFEIRDFIAERKARKIEAGLPYFEIRIGIHTGPVVAGIVGVNKFAYDIWGDTVNTANRMESAGAIGRVNISECTYKLLKNERGLAFTARGKVVAKGKGEMEMYFVDSITTDTEEAARYDQLRTH